MKEGQLIKLYKVFYILCYIKLLSYHANVAFQCDTEYKGKEETERG